MSYKKKKCRPSFSSSLQRKDKQRNAIGEVGGKVEKRTRNKKEREFKKNLWFFFPRRFSSFAPSPLSPPREEKARLINSSTASKPKKRALGRMKKYRIFAQKKKKKGKKKTARRKSGGKEKEKKNRTEKQNKTPSSLSPSLFLTRPRPRRPGSPAPSSTPRSTTTRSTPRERPSSDSPQTPCTSHARPRAR